MRRFVYPVAVALLAIVATRSSAQDDPKDVVRKAIAAHGGAENLTKFKGSRSSTKGSISIMGLDLEYTAESVGMQPDKQKTTIKMDIMGMAITVVQMINGDKISLTVNGNATPVPDTQKADLKQSVEMQKAMGLTPLLDKAYELKALGDSKVDGKDVVGIQASSKELKELKIYFDKSTYLVTKVERMGADPAGGGDDKKQELILGDYKDVKGVKKAMKTTMLTDGKKFMDSVTTKQDLLEKVDDKEFSD